MQYPPPNSSDVRIGIDESQRPNARERTEGSDQSSEARSRGQPAEQTGLAGSNEFDGPDDGNAWDEDGSDGDASDGGISRRRVLRTVVNAGYGAGIVAAVEGWRVLGGPDGNVPITYALAREDVGDAASFGARTTTVPSKWRERLERSFEMRNKIADFGLEGIRELFVVPGAFDDPTVSLSATVADGSVRDRLLDEIELEGVNLDVSVLNDLPPFETPASQPEEPIMVVDEDTRTIPGGVLCQTDSGMLGSLAPQMYDSETGTGLFATANHLFGARGTLTFEHADESLSVRYPGGSTRIATVDRGYPNEDVVGLTPVEGITPASQIYARASVAGQFTRYGLALLKARDIPLEKAGAISGYTAGKIRGIDGITCYFGDVCKEGQLKWGNESVTTDGDSGSVNFAPDPKNPEGSVLIGGFNNARTWWPGANFAWGTAAYHLTESRGLHF